VILLKVFPFIYYTLYVSLIILRNSLHQYNQSPIIILSIGIYDMFRAAAVSQFCYVYVPHIKKYFQNLHLTISIKYNSGSQSCLLGNLSELLFFKIKVQKEP
jgi:hypothetical protein